MSAPQLPKRPYHRPERMSGTMVHRLSSGSTRRCFKLAKASSVKYCSLLGIGSRTSWIGRPAKDPGGQAPSKRLPKDQRIQTQSIRLYVQRGDWFGGKPNKNKSVPGNDETFKAAVPRKEDSNLDVKYMLEYVQYDCTVNDDIFGQISGSIDSSITDKGAKMIQNTILDIEIP
ncbi:hypothetical protein BDV96DRAFT_626823 [Lophiotrema nucula]|uniref:Uncharacterized protein n=1 Tax=Lophiotrema nucula TaxID=690887 RepID=A0A6A5ZVQ9_9PLEO|nr:hypothetical protein BDV96DRAFT_626823 [Lophiotrema nucula]